ncbi:MAG: hypothetical protein K2K14_09795 [Ruminococcus sp.]|nr:hypothetical protein [Ruminococcus sp.]
MIITQSQEIMCQNIASIIDGYRKEELSYTIDIQHVKKWVAQFPPEFRDLLLSETINILSNWYFDTAFIENQFFGEITKFLIKKYHFSSENDICSNVVFLCLQKKDQL